MGWKDVFGNSKEFQNIVFDDVAACNYGQYSESRDWNSKGVTCALHLAHVYYKC